MLGKPKKKESILKEAVNFEVIEEASDTKPKRVVKSDLYAKLNLKKIDKEKLINMLGEVLIENRTLTEEIEKLENENKEYIKSMMKYQGDTKKVEDRVFFIAQHISPEIIIEMNKGTKFNTDQLVNSIIENVLEDRKKTYNIIVRFKEQMRDQKVLLDNLKNQLVQMANDKAERQSEVKENFDINDFIEHTDDYRTEAVKETDNDGNVKLTFKTVNIATLKDKLSAKEKGIIDIVGTLGLSEVPEIYKEAETRNLGITPKVLDDAIKNLESNDILNIDKVKTLNRAAGVQIVKLTTNIGKPLYKEMFGKAAVRSEKEILLKENASYEHGYSIKETAMILKDFGYLDVSYDREKNTISFSGANKWIPDIIAVNSVSKKKEYFEVEMGSQGSEVIEQKLSKANLKCRYLVIIVANKFKQQEMANWVRNWYGKNPGSANTLLTCVKTFKEFKEKSDGIRVGKGSPDGEEV